MYFLQSQDQWAINSTDDEQVQGEGVLVFYTQDRQSAGDDGDQSAAQAGDVDQEQVQAVVFGTGSEQLSAQEAAAYLVQSQSFESGNGSDQIALQGGNVSQTAAQVAVLGTGTSQSGD
ncbi:hypothetical protein [Halomicrobium urmianum]|uniref:hypothetical protein n=1 Tax=Halomicrobium urmianum TaxID=1586233 RepID=UPI001CD9D2E4|nr:hypothetical protein [Halomicrobium urmianum]